MPEPLSIDDVRHVARLARLQLPDQELEAVRVQLGAVLDHIALIEQLDVTDVAPLAHPLDATGRLNDDEPGPTLDPNALLENAPAVEGRFLAVPKVLNDPGGGGA